MDQARASFEACHRSGYTACFGIPGDRYLIGATQGRLHIVAEGEPPQGCFVAAIEAVLNSGQLQGNVSVLMDLRGYTGVVQWDVVSAVRDRFDMARIADFSIAYVVRDAAFLMLVKVASVIFSKAKHKAFLSPDEAEDWLHLRYEAAA